MKKILLLLLLAFFVGCSDKDGLVSSTNQDTYREYKLDVAAGRETSLEILEQSLTSNGSSHKSEKDNLMIRLYREREATKN